MQLNEKIQFKIEDIMTLNIGFDAYGYGSAPSIISQVSFITTCTVILDGFAADCAD